jgi:superfamily II DNA or RNA helicase
MNKNEIKSKVQSEALEAAKEKSRTIVVMATGAGKSKVGIDYAKEIVLNNLFAKILIIVPTEKLRDENWKEEFAKWDAIDIWDANVERCCYVSANKYEGQEFDLVICDEIHNITLSNSAFFYQNSIDKAIGLTATIPENEEKLSILVDLGFEFVYTLSLDKAVKLGLVSPYEITVIKIPLEANKKTCVSGSKDKPFFQTEVSKYEYLTEVMNRAIFSSDARVKTTAMFKILARMRFIYDLKSKTAAARFLLSNLIPMTERTLIFAGGIEQAEDLCPYSFHSKSKKTDSSFDDFKEGRITRLSCVNSLNEGHNIPNLDIGLVVQLNSKALNLIQRIGRIVRYREGHRAQIYILCAKGTQDEIWVEKAIEELDKDCIKYLDYAEIVENFSPVI